MNTRALRRLGDRWIGILGPPGKLLTAGVLISGSIGSASINAPIYHLFCALAAFWGVAFFAAVWYRPRLAIRTVLPGPCTAGETVSIDARIRNTGHRDAFLLSVELNHPPPSLSPRPRPPESMLKRGHETKFSIEIQTLRRGLYGPLQFRGSSLFPLGLFRLGRTKAPKTSLLVYPKFSRLESLDIEVGRKFQPGGIALTSNTGESPEYIGNREYRAGDPIRRIDFKAWARLAKPAVREYQEEYYCRVALVIDTYLPGKTPIPPEGHRELEAAISLCASIADRLALGEYILDIFAAGPELYVFRAGRQTAHFENVLEILACIDPTRENPFELVAPALAGELANVTTLICVLLDWDASRQTLVRTALDNGCAVKAVLVRDGAPSLPLHHADVAITQFDPASILDGRVEAL